MGSILTAIKAIIEESSNTFISSSNRGVQNRANQMGDALEEYVKNAFADCLGADQRTKVVALNRTFSYLGNSNNPPDAMLKGSDAIEIKKIKSLGTDQLQLNSSYPKDKLYSNNPKIKAECRSCEDWKVKDMLYVVGQVTGNEIKNLIFVYGDAYCDSSVVYENPEKKIRDAINSIENVNIADTKELGRINNVDHLGISDLRIRGMWLIKTPFLHFNYLFEDITNYNFRLIAIIPEEKYKSFQEIESFESFCRINGVRINDENIQDPKNPAKLIKTKVIIYYR